MARVPVLVDRKICAKSTQLSIYSIFIDCKESMKDSFLLPLCSGKALKLDKHLSVKNVYIREKTIGGGGGGSM